MHWVKGRWRYTLDLAPLDIAEPNLNKAALDIAVDFAEVEESMRRLIHSSLDDGALLAVPTR